MAYLDKIKSPNDIKNLNISQMNILAAEIRTFLVENVLKTGGHLASNLGVVELTIALLSVFDFPNDKIVFDVGHQSYVYKMLTGRLDKFDTLRRFGGISGFPKTTESKYDCFNVGHASTSVSAALGMARARDLKGTDETVIAVIGDGALTGGMSFEALNDVGSRKTKLIVILNDNEMSIQKNIGGLSANFTKMRFKPRYVNTKVNIQDILENSGKLGKSLKRFIHRIKRRFKYAAIAAPFFEDLGLRYMGIIDGNNTEEVISALNMAKTVDGPVLIHIYTKKGLGYKNAEQNPSKYHGISSLTSKINRKSITYTSAFSSFICSAAENNKKVVAITAAMSSGCGLDEFSQKFPTRFFDVGIAEEHAVTMAAGLAISGYIPVFAVYSTFLQRAYDQLVHDVCLQNLHVVFAIDRAGVTGQDGETHQGLLDLSFLSHIPNMTVLAPSCYDEFRQMMVYAILECKGPVAIRYPKSDVSFRECTVPFEVGKHEIIKSGSDVLMLCCGRMTDTALSTAKMLEDDGVSAEVINIRSIKPFDKQLIENESKGKKLIVTLEDNIKDGGMGQHILSNCDAAKYAPVIQFGFDTCFIPHGKQKELFNEYHLDDKSIYSTITEELNANDRTT